MADRKQFLSNATLDQELKEMLASAKGENVTEEQLHEQRISFAFGNAPDLELITKDSVRHASRHIRLKD